MASSQEPEDPHRDQPLHVMGERLAEAEGAAILLHGRGASAEEILGLANIVANPKVTYFAPQAAQSNWYPLPFVAPVEENEPWLTSALTQIERILGQLAEGGMPREKIALFGFSQGACLALEYAARNPGRYGAVIALSGGLIGPDGALPDYSGDLAGTPVFLGCSDSDAHVPGHRVRESAAIMDRLGGDVTLRLYPGMGHAVNDDEIAAVRAALAALTS